MSEDLKKRVEQFKMLQLPGQPQGMHMGTAYLVDDLWREIGRLEAEAERRLDTNGRMRIDLANAQAEIERLRGLLRVVHEEIKTQADEIEQVKRVATSEGDKMIAEIKRLREELELVSK